jgi:hypothetical protein
MQIRKLPKTVLAERFCLFFLLSELQDIVIVSGFGSMLDNFLNRTGTSRGPDHSGIFPSAHFPLQLYNNMLRGTLSSMVVP